MRGVRHGENLDLETAILWAHIISASVDLPVSIALEKGYAPVSSAAATVTALGEYPPALSFTL